ncbi:MAG: hypothetical protein Q8Q60_03400 [Candidatus Chromulinivorax sp.]|nr:hypothetical protein [Candidatus Chromulinivorax sp.]
MKIIKIIASCIVLSTTYLSCSESVQENSNKKVSFANDTKEAASKQNKTYQPRLTTAQVIALSKPTTSYESIESLNDNYNSDYYLLDEQGREQELKAITRKFAEEHPDAGCTQS